MINCHIRNCNISLLFYLGVKLRLIALKKWECIFNTNWRFRTLFCLERVIFLSVIKTFAGFTVLMYF